MLLLQSSVKKRLLLAEWPVEPEQLRFSVLEENSAISVIPRVPDVDSAQLLKKESNTLGGPEH